MLATDCRFPNHIHDLPPSVRLLQTAQGTPLILRNFANTQ